MGGGETSRDLGVSGQDALHHFCDLGVPSSKTRSSHKLVPLSPLTRLLLAETPVIVPATVIESRLRILASEADASKGKE